LFTRCCFSDPLDECAKFADGGAADVGREFLARDCHRIHHRFDFDIGFDELDRLEDRIRDEVLSCAEGFFRTIGSTTCYFFSVECHTFRVSFYFAARRNSTV
jgi:hypothetical protein